MTERYLRFEVTMGKRGECDLIIKFSMDRIKNMNMLYTWTPIHSDEFDCDGTEEHYHGTDYCKRIIADTMNVLNWGTQMYLGSLERIANETFKVSTTDGIDYRIEFCINTYERKVARLECTITAPEAERYDQKLEELKLAIKNRLIPDWEVCTWLIDMQAVELCKEAYERASIVENNLRAFASKVLIHFLGIDWLNSTGLEKEAESIRNLKQKFIQRVPEFENINADFFSMTLETLVGIMVDGKIYNDDIVLNKNQYAKVWEIAKKSGNGNSIAEFIKSKRKVAKNIWSDLFLPYIDDPKKFKYAIHNFIEDRNHVAHSKVLSWSSYRVILSDFNNMDNLIRQGNSKFDREETSDEVLDTWDAIQEEKCNEREHYRELIASDTGIDILDEDDIRNWFDEVLHDLYSDVYQQYHLDICYEISDFQTPDKGICFTVLSPVLEDNSLRVDVIAEYYIDDELGADSTCTIECKDGTEKTICSAEIHFHNGNGYEGEEGLMEASEDSEYDSSELSNLREELFEYIDEKLNPYPAKLNSYVYENKDNNGWTSNFACGQCGKFGISTNEEFLPIGRCCYCGWDNALMKCERCGELMSADDIVDGFCPSCSAFIDKE